MGYEVNFDKESSKYADCEWFTPSSITYDVVEYNGFLKEHQLT